MQYIIFSDGACFNNGRKNKEKRCAGSHAFAIFDSDKKLLKEHVFGFEATNKDDQYKTTNNFNELMAAIKGIRYIEEAHKNDIEKIDIIIYADSEYVVKGASERIYNWVRNNWRNNENNTVANLILWQEMWRLLHISKFNIKFEWVRGHQNASNFLYEGNNKVDELASGWTKEFIKKRGEYLSESEIKKFD